MAVSPSLYQTLQIDPRAEAVVVQAAYRALMKRHHPDRGGSSVRAQRLNAAYATLGNPVSRRAYDLLRTAPATSAPPSATSAPPPGPRAATMGDETGGGGLVATLRPSLGERFETVDGDGPAWLFDYAGRTLEAPHDRLLIKGFEKAGNAEARAFRMRIEAARLLEPFWRRGPDLFVAVLPRLSGRFTALLRGPRGPLTRLTYAVALLDLSTRTIHAIGNTSGLRSFRALSAVL